MKDPKTYTREEWNALPRDVRETLVAINDMRWWWRSRWLLVLLFPLSIVAAPLLGGAVGAWEALVMFLREFMSAWRILGRRRTP